MCAHRRRSAAARLQGTEGVGWGKGGGERGGGEGQERGWGTETAEEGKMLSPRARPLVPPRGHAWALTLRGEGKLQGNGEGGSGHHCQSRRRRHHWVWPCCCQSLRLLPQFRFPSQPGSAGRAVALRSRPTDSAA